MYPKYIGINPKYHIGNPMLINDNPLNTDIAEKV
jgi:hypothetical protein